jgi:hypothetical protein
MVVLAVVLAIGHGTASAAGVCDAPSVTYPTIQSAVDSPSCSTIVVAPGTYAENVVIKRALTLNGARAGVDARTRSGAESTIVGGTSAAITVTADNVTIDGFTLDGPVSQGTAGIVMQNGNTGETVQNNIFNNPGRAASITTSNTTFRRNDVRNTVTAGDGFQTNTTPVHDLTIADNRFKGANPNNYNADITVIEGNANVTVSGNSSIGDGTLVALFKTNGARIVDNTVVDGGGSSAIYIGGANSNVTVKGNHVSAAGAAVKVANAYGDGPNANVTIVGNTLRSSLYGVFVTAPAVTSADTVVAHQNNIAGNTLFGINNDAIGTLDGSCNWWGSASGPGPVGPGAGDKVSPRVAYAAWLVAPAPEGKCIGGNVPTSKDQCKDGGWENEVRADGSTFRNQGACIQYVNQGGERGDQPPGGDDEGR